MEGASVPVGWREGWEVPAPCRKTFKAAAVPNGPYQQGIKQEEPVWNGLDRGWSSPLRHMLPRGLALRFPAWFHGEWEQPLVMATLRHAFRRVLLEPGRKRAAHRPPALDLKKPSND